MFNLGEYEEEDAKEIRTFLSDAGMRVELKPFLVVEEGETCTLNGRFSQLKDVAKNISDYELYLSALKSVLPRSTTEDEFNELLMKELDPASVEKRDKILALCESKEDSEGEGNSENEKESPELSPNEWLEFILKSTRAQQFAESVLSLNDIKIGMPIDNKLDDPLVEIPVNPNDYDSEPEQLKTTVEFHLEKSFGIYIDEFTTPLSSELDEEFCDLYPEEYESLRALGLLIEKLATSPTSRKMDFEEFIENCTMRLRDDDVDLLIDGKDVAEELARVLEKSDVLKVKGDKVKWKS